MSKRIILNAFDMGCVSHQAAGTWRHPDSQAYRYNDLRYWTDLARTLEAGAFDSLFIADVLGTYDVYRGSVETALADADQVPLIDPALTISAMAAVTERLGFGVTMATTYELPYALARKFSTLDHLTNGRVAWNVVTSYLNSAAVNLGLDQQKKHGDRYDIADEFLDVTYKLWEGSWEEDAVVIDRETGVYSDPSKVHPIAHEGEYFSVPGIGLSEPSPQRTPVIFQAGASPRGRAFAAKHAEGIFIAPQTLEQAKEAVTDLRRRASENGRDPGSLKIFSLITIITDETDERAQAKYEEYLRTASGEGMLAFYGGWTGVDFSEYDPDRPLEYVDNDSIKSVLSMLTTIDPEREWTVRDIVEQRSIGGLGPVLVGGPETVADHCERYVDEAGLDGFNIAYAVTPGTFTDFIEHAVPELRRRGRVQNEYSATTLRGALSGTGDARVAEDHPAARYRGAYVGLPSAATPTKPTAFTDRLGSATSAVASDVADQLDGDMVPA